MNDPSQYVIQLKQALNDRDRAGVNAACAALISRRARLGGQWPSIIFALIQNGELTLARAAADVLASETGHSPLGRFQQAATYARTGRLDAAAAILAGLPNDVPDPLGNAYIQGTLATNLGQFEEATTHLQRAVTLNPASGQSWLALAMLGRVSTQNRTAMFAARQEVATAPDAERGPYHYAVGKALDELGDHDAAFAAFNEGARIIRAGRLMNDALETVRARGAVQDWTAKALSELPIPTGGKERSIFVTGLPRSGTTLVEQILVSHSAVDDGEELGRLPLIAQEIGGMSVDKIQSAAAAGKLIELLQLYDHLVDERFSGSGRIVDKTLQASRCMGLIAAVMPDAPVIWLRRDPLDNAWSIFRTYFMRDLGWTFDLPSIGRQMAAEDRLFNHWTALRPSKILPVCYAELVSHPSKIIPRIVEHCGLSLEPQQLNPHQSRRAVTTASVAQVRQPINQRPIGSALPYRRHLQPFIDAYRDAGGVIED